MIVIIICSPFHIYVNEFHDPYLLFKRQNVIMCFLLNMDQRNIFTDREGMRDDGYDEHFNDGNGNCSRD